MKNKTCALTGHRVLQNSFNESKLKEELEKLIKEGYDFFYCGMAEGFDLIALKALLFFKKNYPIKIEACIPYKGQEKRFSSEMKDLYLTLLPECDETTVFFESYTDGCYLLRNRYMVDCAECVFAYCKKDTGGTAYTIRYAKKKKKKIVYSMI